MDVTWSSYWATKTLKDKIIAIAAVGLSVFQLYTSIFGSLDAIIQRSIHLGTALFMIFLIYTYKGKRAILSWVFSIASIAVMGYLLWNYDWVVAERFSLITPLLWYEKLLGVVLILMVLEVTRQVVGGGLVVCALIFLIYPLAGPHLPSIFHTTAISVSDIIDFNYLSLGGILGIPLGISATEIAQFIIFGAILLRTGGGDLINNVAAIVAGRMVGGPAKVAVLASSLMGTISGSGTANVATVGTLTIPVMKKAGYSATFAAAVESVASTGGQIMPPIMGAAAFVMSGFTGIPYVTIIGYAIFPAILFYLSLFVTVDLEARRLNLKGVPPDMTLKATLRDYGHMAFPVVILLYLLIAGYTPRLAGGYSAIAAIAFSFIRSTTRPNLPKILEALEAGAKGMLIVIVSTAAAGIIIGSVDLTGLGQRLSSGFMGLTGGYLFLGLVMAMVIAIILGCGMPTTPAYIIMVATIIPGLIGMGLPIYVAHMFAFYFACMSLVTPPVAPTAYTAAAIAGADGWKTGWLALRLALIGFIVPYLFAYSPTLLLVGAWWDVLLSVSTACIGVYCLAIAGEGFFLRRLTLVERIIAGVAAVCLIIPSKILIIPGIVCFTFLLGLQLRLKELEIWNKLTRKE